MVNIGDFGTGKSDFVAKMQLGSGAEETGASREENRLMECYIASNPIERGYVYQMWDLWSFKIIN